jgi:hypothetical protein
MGVTAARETLDAALGQKVQTAGGTIAKPCQIGRQKNRQGLASLPRRPRFINKHNGLNAKLAIA